MKLLEMNIPPQAFIYGAIYMLANRLQIIGDRLDPTITSKQWFVLAIVSKFTEKPPNIGDVAEVFGTSRQNIKKMANILEKQGFLEFRKDKKDLRNIMLILTEKSFQYFQSRQQQEAEYMEKIFHGIDSKQLDVLCVGLKQLSINIDKLLEGKTNVER